MAKSYNDPVKQKARERQREFIKRNLSFRNPRDINVLCFPGAETDGEEAIEVREIYDQLGIPRKNIVGLEADREKASRLERANLGIMVENSLDLDYFRETKNQFDIISLDYTGYRDESRWQVLHEIAGRQILRGCGLLCTNYSARRETKQNQAQMLALQVDRYIFGGEEQRINSLEQEIEMFSQEGKINLSEMRDNLTYRTMAILGMGTSALKGIDLLTTYPNYNQVQEALSRAQEQGEITPGKVDNFHLSHGYESGIDNNVTNPLCYLYRVVHLDHLSNFIAERNGFTKNMARFITDMLVEREMGSQFKRDMERYSYISNKNFTMEMDLISVISAERIYKKFRGNLFYNPKTGKVTIRKMNRNEFCDAWEETRKKRRPKIPERIHLGSSWVPPKRKQKLSEEQARELLEAGFSCKEIAEEYRGFTTMQLAGMKAHMTRRKNATQS